MTKKKAAPKAEEVEAKKGPSITKEALAQMFRDEIDKNIRACREELDRSNKEILDKYQCDLDISVTVTARGNIPSVTVVPRPPKQ